MKHINLNIGDIAVSTIPSVLETILGSCVAVCLWDEDASVGGMNHIMLPRRTGNDTPLSFCCHESIEMLVERMLRHGASIPNTRAKLFGGGRVLKGCSQVVDVGGDNVRAAKDCLLALDIPLVGECVENERGLKIRFHSHNGRAFVKFLQQVN